MKRSEQYLAKEFSRGFWVGFIIAEIITLGIIILLK
jgi:hypothetical protein